MTTRKEEWAGIGEPNPLPHSTGTRDKAQLYAALAKAQAQIMGAAKSSNNPFFNSSYADLAAVWDACREPLTDNGLCIMQMPENGPDGTITVRTRLGHESGEYIESCLSLPIGKGDAHGMGSAITYGRRYALSAFVGIPQIDDDGNAATQSAFSSKQMKTKVWKALKDAAATDDVELARKTWDSMKGNKRSEMQTEIWGELSSGQCATLKKLLAETQEAA
ncbi:MAG: ERF family protein [Pseudomonadota bacterium]